MVAPRPFPNGCPYPREAGAEVGTDGKTIKANAVEDVVQGANVPATARTP